MARPERKAVASSFEEITKTIEACIANGDRLIDDALMLEFQTPTATRLVLSMIAQEEFAKAFLLFLVREEAIDWSPHLLRAMNDHSCKQLVGTVIEYISPNIDESYDEMLERIRAEVALGENLPVAVADAISILRHEKMRRWESRSWEWAEPPNWDATALRIAEGGRDRLKQDALYVRLGRDGSIVSSPSEVSDASSEAEFERAYNYRRFMMRILEEGGYPSSEYTKIKAFIVALFANKNTRTDQ